MGSGRLYLHVFFLQELVPWTDVLLCLLRLHFASKHTSYVRKPFLLSGRLDFVFACVHHEEQNIGELETQQPPPKKARISNCFVVRGHRLQDFWVILGKLNRWLNILGVPTSITDMWIRASWYLQIPCNIWLLPWFHIFHGIEITMMHEPFTRCVCKGESHMCFDYSHQRVSTRAKPTVLVVVSRHGGMNCSDADNVRP